MRESCSSLPMNRENIRLHPTGESRSDFQHSLRLAYYDLIMKCMNVSFPAKARVLGSGSTRPSVRSTVVAGLLMLFVGLAQAQQPNKSAARVRPEHDSTDAARGKYLVENVAMCGQCHTERDSNGNLEQSRALQGAPVPWVPAGRESNWPLTAPRIGGTPPASDADMVKLLTTGIWITGRPLRFPMMPFRMSEGDAKAVVAYLKSLTLPQ